MKISGLIRVFVAVLVPLAAVGEVSAPSSSSDAAAQPKVPSSLQGLPPADQGMTFVTPEQLKSILEEAGLNDEEPQAEVPQEESQEQPQEAAQGAAVDQPAAAPEKAAVPEKAPEPKAAQPAPSTGVPVPVGGTFSPDQVKQMLEQAGTTLPFEVMTTEEAAQAEKAESAPTPEPTPAPEPAQEPKVEQPAAPAAPAPPVPVGGAFTTDQIKQMLEQAGTTLPFEVMTAEEAAQAEKAEPTPTPEPTPAPEPVQGPKVEQPAAPAAPSPPVPVGGAFTTDQIKQMLEQAGTTLPFEVMTSEEAAQTEEAAPTSEPTPTPAPAPTPEAAPAGSPESAPAPAPQPGTSPGGSMLGTDQIRQLLEEAGTTLPFEVIPSGEAAPAPTEEKKDITPAAPSESETPVPSVALPPAIERRPYSPSSSMPGIGMAPLTTAPPGMEGMPGMPGGASELSLLAPTRKPSRTVPDTPPPGLPEPLYPTLLAAAEAGDIADVENHILRGEDMNLQDAKGHTALHCAVENNRLDILELLLDYGADPQILSTSEELSVPTILAWQNENWAAAALLREFGSGCSIHHAAGYGDVEGVRAFLKSDILSLEELNASRQTPLHTAAAFGKVDVVALLLEYGADQDALDLGGQTPFAMAALNGHANVVKFMAEQGVDVDWRMPNRETVMHLKARLGDTSLMELLLELGADINAKSKNGSTPLHVAAASKQEEMVEFLIDHGALMYAQDKQGRTPMHVAARLGLAHMVDLLISKGASISRKDRAGAVPLHIAALHGRKEAAELLLDRGSPVGVTDKRNQTPLHNVVQTHEDVELSDRIPEFLIPKDDKAPVSERKALVDLFLARGADLEARNRYGATPLHMAARHGDPALIRHLCVRGAQLEARENNGRTPLFFALQHDHAAAVRELVDQGADIRVKDNSGITPLHLACELNHADLAELLISKGAEVMAADHNARTPLHAAAERGTVEIGQVLLTEGASPNARDIVGRFALHLAAMRGDVRFLKLLIANGANVNAKDRNGRSPMHVAAWEGHWGPVQILIGDGADVNAVDSHKVTPLHIAAEVGHARMVRFLISKGADPNVRNSDGYTPLRLAQLAENREVEEILAPYALRQFELALKAGDYAAVKEVLDANPSLVNHFFESGLGPMHMAARGGDRDVVELLLAMGASVGGIERNEDGMTPLHEAAQRGDAEMVELLLMMGADPNAIDKQGTTPVDRALGRGRSDLAKVLEEAGGKSSDEIEKESGVLEPSDATGSLAQLVHAMTHNRVLGSILYEDLDTLEEAFSQNPLLVDALFLGAPPLYLASMLGKKEAVQFLLDSGADVHVEAKTSEGGTALHQAARHGHRDIVELLLSRGANPTVKDKMGATPIDLAQSHAEVAALLKQYMGMQ